MLVIARSDSAGSELAGQLARDLTAPFDCVGIVWHNGNETYDAEGRNIPEDQLAGFLTYKKPDVLVLAGPDDYSGLIGTILDDAATLKIRTVDIHAFYEHAFGRVPLHGLPQMWFMSIIHLYQKPYSLATKRIVDLVLAASCLALSTPLLALTALAVRCSGGGPILYRQTRLGEGGRLFEIVKFRTMREDAEEGGAVWAREGDARVTPLGRTLRRTRIDELPQLWNVLLGAMSMVGPRPERPEFLEMLRQEVPFWTRRQLVKPGITGWAQVHNGYAGDVSGTVEKLSYDLYYIKHRSALLDIAIIVKTMQVMCRGLGAR